MSIIYMLLAISVMVALLFFIAFIISVKSGQYDDTYTPSVRMLFEDEIIKEKTQITTPKKEQTPLTSKNNKFHYQSDVQIAHDEKIVGYNVVKIF